MNKFITKVAKLVLGLSLAAGVGVAVGTGSKASRVDAAQGDTVYVLNTTDGATSSGTTHAYQIATSTTYNNYSANNWALTCGNKSTSDPKGMWMGANNNNKARMTLGQGSYAPAAAIATAIGVTTSATYYSALYQTSGALSNVGSVTITYGGTGGTAPSEAWVVYSTDSGTSWSLFGAKKTTITSGMEFTHNTVSSALYGFVIHCTAWGNLRTPVITFKEGATGGPTVTGVTVTGTSSKTSYSTVDSWSNAGLTANVSMSDSSTYGGTVAWSYTPDLTPAAAVIANSNDEVTGYSLTATATADEKSGSKTTTGVSVSYATVAQGLAAVPNANDELDNVIVKGIVSRIDSIDTTTYYNATYFISDDGDESNELEIYRGKGVANANITNVNDIKVGDIVVVYGNLKYYNGSTKEFLQGNYLLSLDRPASTAPSVTITEASFTMSLGDADVTLHETHENLPEGGSIKWVSGTPATATIDQSTGVVHAVATGTTEITAQVLDSGSNVVASNSITVTVVSCPIHVGDEIYFYAEYSSTTYYMSAVGQTSSSTESEKITFTVESGYSAGSFSFKHGSDYLKCTASSPYLGSGEDKDNTTSWTVVDNGSAIVITSVSTTTRSIMWNYNNGNPRFGAYASPSATILRVQIGLPAAPTYVTLNKSTLTLENGSSETLTYTTDEYVGFTWVSSDPSVATVDSTGLVECEANSGSAVIRVFYDADKDGTYDVGEPTDTCTVTATAAQIHFADSNYGGVATRIDADSTGTSLDGKKVIFGCASQTAISGSLSGQIISSHDTDEESFTVSYDSSNHKFTLGNGRTDTGVTVYTLHSVSSGVYSISTVISGNTKYLTETQVKKLAYDDSAYSWNISISSGTATIQSTDGYLKYNSGSPRFTTYASGQTDIEIYEFASYYDEATEYAEYFVGGTTGTCADTISDWSDLGDMFNDLSSGAQNIYKIATHLDSSSYSHEVSVEHAVARYDDALLKHSELRTNEFMGRVAEGTLSYSSPNVVLVSIAKENTNTVAIIVIISLVSVTAIGGYFFLKRREEN